MIIQRCAESAPTESLNGRAWRCVESQEQVATMGLVDTPAEQALLEQLLEQSKPGTPSPQRHYLLSAPFRYPPLPHGSRFGGRHEPSLFYASCEINTALAETAYYRLLFLDGMTTPPSRLISQHTVFAADYGCQRGLRLQGEAFVDCRSAIVDRRSYEHTQAFGSWMRGHAIQAFEYPSARDPLVGLNVALFTAKALVGDDIIGEQQWLSDTRVDGVSFSRPVGGQRLSFERHQFMVDGALPAPAV